MRSEARLLAGHQVRCSGGRIARARDLARQLLDDGAQGLVSFGIAGALDPRLATGRLVIATSVVVGEQCFDADAGWREGLCAALPEAVAGIVAGSPEVVATPAAKAALHARRGAIAVDMESGAVAEACAGENLLLGLAEAGNYNTIVAAAMVHKHTVIAQSPLDINMCKQLNILISEMGLPLDRIIIDPSIGGLGYGLEYAYSVGERSRIGALQGDKMLALPVLGTVGFEAWKAKEANVGEDEFPGWGDQAERGILWEATTGSVLLQSGLDILVMRHPEAVALVKKNLAALMAPSCL